MQDEVSSKVRRLLQWLLWLSRPRRLPLPLAHSAIDSSEEGALLDLDAQYSALYRTKDFLKERTAEAEGCKPVYHGN